MISPEELSAARRRAQHYLKQAGIVLTPEEAAGIEVADFGLGELDTIGLELVTYINTSRVCAKELVMFPHQTCPEHRHPPIDGEPGKEETFRCRWGVVYLYVKGEPAGTPHAAPPAGREEYYTMRREIMLRAGEQHTIMPDTRHWFQAGPEGAVISEFSTRSRDEFDIFTDPAIQRETLVAHSY
ncbi:MAG: D-lyxose/D-mannose family sugar isomerase [Janthinobacterium lividum]